MYILMKNYLKIKGGVSYGGCACKLFKKLSSRNEGKKMPELKKFHIVFGGVNVAHLFFSFLSCVFLYCITYM